MIDNAQRILEKFPLKKNDFIDIRIEEGNGILITIQNGRPEQITYENIIGVGIRALIDGGWGFVSNAGINPQEIQNGVNKAVRIAESTARKVKEKGQMPENYCVQGVYKVKNSIDPRNIPLETKYEIVKEFEKITRCYSERIVSTNASMKQWFQKEYIVNSLGTKVESEYGNINLLCAATSREGEIMQNVYTAKGTTFGWEEIEKYDVVKNGTDLGRRAIELLDAKKPPSGKKDIIMDPSLVGVYVHESMGHAQEADSVLAKESILEGKIGQKIGSNKMNIYDDPTIPGLRGSYYYDSEGTKTIKRQLVKEGIQIGFLHSLETATKMGVEPNGAARATDFSHRPIVRMGNTYIDHGDYSFEELLELVKNGVYLEHSYGGYVDTAKGEFYFTAQGGYLIKNSELADPIQNVSMSGLCLEVLEKTTGLSKNLRFDFPGSCGKEAQWIPIHAGGPFLAVKQIVIGGQ